MATEEQNEIPVEDHEEPLLVEEVLKKHRQERKDLQARVQALKRTATKGDKKKKKEVAEAIVRLEQELNEKQDEELRTMSVSNPIDEVPIDDQEIEGESEDQTVKVTRAQKRRNKKLTADRDRDKRIVEQEETNREGPRNLELNTIRSILLNEGLQIHNIPADGNCLYCAISHQLEITGRSSLNVNKLRKLTADYIRDNREDFIPFMCNDDDENIDEENFEKYCKDVAGTKMWGGQLELVALSNVLKCPIKVIQATGPSTVQGDHFSGEPLTLTYHKHMYRLGEHYNSTIRISQLEDEP